MNYKNREKENLHKRVLCGSTYIKFKNRQNYLFIVIKVRIGRWTEIGRARVRGNLLRGGVFKLPFKMRTLKNRLYIRNI